MEKLDLKKSLRPIILMFIIIVLGVAFFITSANTITPLTTQGISTNESFNIASSRQNGNNINNTADVNYTVRYAQNATGNAPISAFTLLNASGATIQEGGNYSVDLTVGRFSLRNSTYMVGLISNQTYASYTYYDANYDDNDASRLMWPLIILMGTVGTLIVVIAANWSKYKEVFGI